MVKLFFEYIGIILFLISAGVSPASAQVQSPGQSPGQSPVQAPAKIEVQVLPQAQGPSKIQVQVIPQAQSQSQPKAQAPAQTSAPAPAPARPQHFTSAWKLYRLTPADMAEAGQSAPYLAVFLLSPDLGWHAYANVPGETGRPTQLTVRIMPGDRTLPVLYPPGERTRDQALPDKTVNVYQGQVSLFIPLALPEDGKFTLNSKLRMLLCGEGRCLPMDSDSMFLGAGLDVNRLPSPGSESWWPGYLALARGGTAQAQAPQPPSALSQAMAEILDQEAAAPEEFKAPATWDFHPRVLRPGLEVSALIPAVLMGLLAGFLLNFMPCVLPVVCLKLSAIMIAPSREDCPGCPPTEVLFREHNLFFALGVLVYFLLLSVVLGYTGLAWGQMFQTPGLVLGLVVLVFALSLSLFGLYTLPMVDLKRARDTHQSPRSQAFFTGFLATLLATPCSGPFLGGVLSWALVQPPYIISSVFMSIGLGMASPYILMTYVPGMVRYFPKPGAWTLYMEKAVAFFLMGTCIYLLNILPRDLVVPALIVLWLTGLTAWAWGTSAGFGSRLNMLATRAAAGAVLAFGLYLALLPAPPRADWEAFEPARFEAMLGKKRMLVDFTAEWCPTCKLLEQTVLTRDNLARWKARYDLTFVRADLTENDPAALALLKILGSRSIPVAAIFEPGERAKEPLVIRDLFTTGQLEEALGGK